MRFREYINKSQIKITGSKDPTAVEHARQLSHTYEGGFKAVNIRCPHCGKPNHIAMPQDMEGAAAYCQHCDKQML